MKNYKKIAKNIINDNSNDRIIVEEIIKALSENAIITINHDRNRNTTKNK